MSSFNEEITFTLNLTPVVAFIRGCQPIVAGILDFLFMYGAFSAVVSVVAIGSWLVYGYLNLVLFGPIFRKRYFASILEIVEAPLVTTVEGDFSLENGKPRIVMKDTPSGPLEVMLDNDLFNRIVSHYTLHTAFVSNVIMRGKEMAVPGSVATKVDKWTSGVVALHADGNQVAMGFRLAHDGNTYLVTAAHALRGLIGRQVTVRYDNKQLKMSDSWPIVAYSPKKSLDFVAIEAPKEFWSVLGVKALKPNSVFSGSATVYGFGNMGLMSSSGGIARDNRNAFALKHFATTVPGYSGAPLIASSGVVGVHTGATREGEPANEATAISAILMALQVKESPFTGGRNHPVPWDEMDEPDSEEILYGRGGRIDIRARGSDYATKLREDAMREPQFVGKSWADIEDDDEDLPITWENKESSPIPDEVDDGAEEQEIAPPPELLPVKEVAVSTPVPEKVTVIEAQPSEKEKVLPVQVSLPESSSIVSEVAEDFVQSPQSTGVKPSTQVKKMKDVGSGPMEVLNSSKGSETTPLPMMKNQACQTELASVPSDVPSTTSAVVQSEKKSRSMLKREKLKLRIKTLEALNGPKEVQKEKGEVSSSKPADGALQKVAKAPKKETPPAACQKQPVRS